ncbi:MtrB/PioB family decaheme-associated outer membrane protein [Piscinibacter gummiphilus]|uniref:MtrB/PioB family decaheme-associated outer membrane protein n=1 Tax=Piscinibacter gummiphilus TaxID=946333 RepID=A0ABZ0D044_9BURK|nr:MtrB/PioB family decaheme-associated outer membrane protein [Piscinibacter gummiphilus]WOB10615.1 MtrB/PioB family decaheme-associated outer membrane protein [Piscinibacter gummiphilus]
MSRLLRAGVIALLAIDGQAVHADDDPQTSASVQASGGTLQQQREVELGATQPGDWKAMLRLRDATRQPPLQRLSSPVVNGGTTQPQVSTAPDLQEVDLHIRRTELGLHLDKAISSRLRLDLDLSHGRRTGNRLTGRGVSCPTSADGGCAPPGAGESGWAVLLLPEPLHDEHTQLEARLAYAGPQWQLSGGYHGSYFRNLHDTLVPSVPAALYNATGTLVPLAAGLQSQLQQPIALPPDSNAHHLDLTGSYAFNRHTRVAAKLAREQVTQRQSFADAGLPGAPAGVTDLGGETVTTHLLVRLTSRPLPRLSINGELSRRERDDRTPLAAYHVEGATQFTNRRLPHQTDRARVQALYQLDRTRQGSLSLEHEAIDRGVFTSTAAIAGTTALRQHTRETTLRASARQQVDDGLGAALTLLHARRSGSNWLRDNSGAGVTEVTNPADPSTGFATGIFMPTLADRDRDEVQLSTDWQADSRLHLSVSARAGRDRYSSPSPYGLHGANTRWIGLDVDYALPANWRLDANVSHATQRLPQSRPSAAAIVFDNRSTQAGVGLTGQPHERLQIGAALSFADDLSRYRQTLDTTAGLGDAELLAASGGLPDVRLRQRTLALFARGKAGEQAHWRLDLRYSHTRWNDWAYGCANISFPYADGSRLLAAPRQEAASIGLRYTLPWR